MLKNYRIPIVERAQYAGSYHGIPVASDHPLHPEPLVRLDDYGVACRCYHARRDGANPPYHGPVAGSRPDVWIRRSVAEKLVQVNRLLAPHGRELLVLDGYRSIDCQRGLWTFYRAQARRLYPGASPEAQRCHALKYLVDPTHFDPRDSRTWPSHSNGGAVDITLRDTVTGRQVDMGAQFESLVPESANDYFERQLDAGELSPEDPRLQNRRLLHYGMQSQGFTNDPFVYWHYDWGNQLHFKIRQRLYGDPPGSAWYGYVPDPP